MKNLGYFSKTQGNEPPGSINNYIGIDAHMASLYTKSLKTSDQGIPA